MRGDVRMYALLGILALLFFNWTLWEYAFKGNDLRVTFFDVGQGDAIFIETPQGHRILIDGGPNGLVAAKIGERMPFWEKTIDLMILTHTDADHITGQVDVFEQYEVEAVLWTGAEHTSAIYEAWKQALAKEQTHVMLAWAPQKLIWSQDPSAFMEILYPSSGDLAESKSSNNLSVVSRLVFGDQTFLFTGDIERIVEQELVDEEVDLTAGVVKIPHHGSKTSSSESFLAAVAPQLAVIQVGRNNRYGHPTQEVLDRLSAFGIAVLRTDLQGDIMISYDPVKNRTHTRYY